MTVVQTIADLLKGKQGQVFTYQSVKQMLETSSLKCSVQVSDLSNYCYNICHGDRQSAVSMKNQAIFEKQNGSYIFRGFDYPYTGVALQKGTMVRAKWNKGQLEMFYKTKNAPQVTTELQLDKTALLA